MSVNLPYHAEGFFMCNSYAYIEGRINQPKVVTLQTDDNRERHA